MGIGISLSSFAAVTPATPITSDASAWRAHAGDRIVIDTKETIGYIIHPDGMTLEFPVATGQRRGVCYIGRCYNATTPERVWQIREKNIKGDRITFGPSGRFLRLFYKDASTPYGFHEYGYEERMFDDSPRFKSMGCIIVRSGIMDILDQTFAVNEGAVDVVTAYGAEEELRAAWHR